MQPEWNGAFHRIWLGQGVVVSVAFACVRGRGGEKVGVRRCREGNQDINWPVSWKTQLRFYMP